MIEAREFEKYALSKRCITVAKSDIALQIGGLNMWNRSLSKFSARRSLRNAKKTYEQKQLQNTPISTVWKAVMGRTSNRF